MESSRILKAFLFLRADGDSLIIAEPVKILVSFIWKDLFYVGRCGKTSVTFEAGFSKNPDVSYIVILFFIYCICIKGFTLLSMMINEVLSFCLSRGHFHDGATQKPTLKRSQESRANNWCHRSWHISIHALTFHIFSLPKMDQDPGWIFKLGWSQIVTLIFLS